MIQQTKEVETRPATPAAASSAMDPGRFFVALAGLAVVIGLLVLGFLYLRNSTGANLFNAIVAIIWGVGGVAALFYTVNAMIESLPLKWRSRLLPFLFVGPGMAMLLWVLTVPTLRTFYQSFFNADSTVFVGLDNYAAIVTDKGMQESFRNNLLWLFVGTGFCVIFGLLIAVLADRSRFETIAKALIFMPMAISFVGAGVIWKFMYAYAPGDQPQIGLQNAVFTAFGLEPQSWLTLQPWNNLFLIIVQVWMGTGFCMVLFSAALKGVPMDLIEASRVDGATEIQSFFRIIIPYIQGTIITVTTTTAIGTLKIFDVVWVMTGGQYGTSVVGTEFYRQFFANRNFGYGSAIAIVLFIAISPVLIYNLRQLKKQEGF